MSGQVIMKVWEKSGIEIILKYSGVIMYDYNKAVCLDQNWDFLFDQIRLHNKIVSVVETWVGDSFNRQTQLPGDEFITFWESSLPVIYTQN